MDSLNKSGELRAAHTTQSDPPPPRRAATVVTASVVALTAALLAWSLFPVLSPAPEVSVVQAVFERQADLVSVSERSPDDSQEADAAARPGRVAPTVQAPGWLEADPFYTACAALADGVIESVDVLEGERVEKGQVVARLVAEDAEIALRRIEADLAAAESAVALAAAERDAASRNWDEPFELVRAVEAGRASLLESEAELALLPTQIDAAQAVLTRLEEETTRVRRSSARGATSEFELIAAEQREIGQRAELATLRAREPLLGSRVARLRAELHAAERALELRIEDRRRLDAARANVAQAEARVAQARAARDAAALELDRMSVRAPITGYVQSRLKVPGDKVMRAMDDRMSNHIVHLYDPEQIQVRVDVPLADASHVSVGQACEVIVEVLPDRVFRGEVTRTTHEADLQKNTLQFKVRVLDPDPILRPEMLTRVKFLPSGGAISTGAPEQPADSRVRVPERTIEGTGDNTRVWLVTDRKNGRGVLAERAVRVLARADGWASIAGDIQPGALLAVNPSDPSNGATVKFRSDPDGSQPARREGRSS